MIRNALATVGALVLGGLAYGLLWNIGEAVYAYHANRRPLP